MKNFFISFLVVCILVQCIRAQSVSSNTAPGPKQTEEITLPLDSFRGKEIFASTQRGAIDVYNVGKLEKYINSLKDGDYFKEGNKFFVSKEELLKDINKRNEEKIQKYKDSLPMDGKFYVVEGDLLLSADDITEYLSVTSRINEFQYLKEGDPMVNISDGEDDYYRTLEKRKLNYAIDRRSFSELQYKQIVEDMNRATKEWQDACPSCGIIFTHLEVHDLEPSLKDVNFIVRSHDVKGIYIASAFFPHASSERRYLNIDPLFFTPEASFDRVGVLRHQLGHILGYRHVQPKDIAGCYYKDGKFLPLAAYTMKSVMQYFCSGDIDVHFEIGESDRAFHKKLYRLPELSTSDGGNLSTTSNILVIQFQGGDVPDNAARILKELVRLARIRTARYKVAGSDETAKTIYESRLHFPFYSQGFAGLANELNSGQVKEGPLNIGTEVLYPDVKFLYYEQTLRLDPDSKEDKAFKTNLSALNLIVKERGSGPIKLITVKAYELRLAIDSKSQLGIARDEVTKFIREKNLVNVLVSSQEGSESSPTEMPPQYFTSSSMSTANNEQLTSRQQENLVTEYLSPTSMQQNEANGVGSKVEDISGFLKALDRQGVKVGTEGGLRFLVDMQTLPPSFEEYRCNPKLNCPEIILVDTEVYPHPDLGNNLKRLYPNEDGESVLPKFTEQFTEETGGRQKIWLVSSKPGEDEHGTYMAGIIASQINNYGIVGLSPGAQIYSIDWEVFIKHRLKLKEILAERDRNGRRTGKQQIVVFATDWPLSKDRLIRADDRWSDSLAAYIKGSTLLVVAAIGQPRDDEEDKRPKEIDQLFPNGPTDLGDLDNVIIVTACEDCYGIAPRILGIANIPAENAKNMVHIAAPGVDIPGPVKPEGNKDVRYAKASGTSPATALVAGVISEMISYWPNSYKLPSDVKTRIQVASRPTLLNEDANGLTLSVGILDPSIALRDPAKNWLLKEGKWNTVDNFTWSVDEIPVRDPKTGKKPKVRINTEEILRIYRLNRKGQTYWIFYNKTEKVGVIERYGPFTVDPKFQRNVLINIGTEKCPDPSRGTKYALDEITDLILSDANSRIVYCDPNANN